MKRTGNLLTSGFTLGLVVALLSGCAGTAKVSQPAAQTAPLQLEAAKPAVVPETQNLSGKVVETMNAGGYTYISLESGGKNVWVAVPSMQVSVGQEIKLRPVMQMGKFTSSTLKRTFDSIIFSSGPVSDANSQATQVQPTAEAATGLPSGHIAIDNKAKPKGVAAMMNASTDGETAGSLSGKVVETMDAGGYTYIKLEKEGKQTWVAVPTMKVTAGEELELQPGTVMTNFTSKSLNKTFESVVFSGGPVHSK